MLSMAVGWRLPEELTEVIVQKREREGGRGEGV